LNKTKSYKHFLITVICIFCMLVIASCTKDTSKKELPKPVNKVKVGFSMGTLMQDRWIRDRDIFMAIAQQKDIDVIVKNANNDSEIQYNQVLDMLKQKIDVLVIAPNDSYTEKRCVQAAKSINVPVISYDRLVADGNADLYISFDHYKVGEEMAKHLVEKVPSGGYMIINGSKNDHNSTLINEGAKKVLKSYLDKQEISIIAETWVDGWVREDAYTFASEQIKLNKDRIDAVICGNDSLAWGVIDALAEAQITEKVKVTGQDADLVACQRIVMDMQTMTVYKPIKNLVEETVEACLKLANGEKPEYQGIINDGTYDIPYIYIDVQSVTKDNLDSTIIKDGFHLSKDVYQTN